MIERGNEVTVLAPNANWLSAKNTIVNESVQEWRTSPPPFIKIQRFLTSKGYLVSLLKVFNILVNYLPIPDMFSGWFLVSKIIIDKNFNPKHFDIVITSSGGYSAHLIGNYINRKFGSKWVADYGDPWGLNIYGKKKRLPFFLEKRILRGCSALFFTTQNTINAYKKNHQLSEIKIYNLPCGYDESILIKNKSSNKKYKIVYTGVAYSLSRNLSNAVIAISKLNNCNFEIVGSYSEKFVELAKSLKTNNIYFRGKVSYDDSIDIIQNSDILLHIGNFGTLQIPGKTYIYLGTPKPIIYIKQEETDDPTLDFLLRFEGVLVTENNSDSIEKSLKEVTSNYEFYLNKSINRVNSDELKKFIWSNLGDYFDKCLREVIKK